MTWTVNYGAKFDTDKAQIIANDPDWSIDLSIGILQMMIVITG